MRARVVHAAGLLLAVLVTGCDPIWGISRRAPVAELPELSCVRSAIESVPGVTEVRDWEVEGSRPVTLTGIQRPDRIHWFAYRYESIDAALTLTTDYEGEVEYYQGIGAVGSAPPSAQAAVDRIRPVMIQVEAAVAERCGLPQLGSEIEEHCADVRCED